MEEDKRALWTCLVEDLEEEYKAPVPPRPNGKGVVRGAPPAPALAHDISALERRDDVAGPMGVAAFSVGSTHGPPPSSPFSASGNWTCGLNRTATRFHQPQRRLLRHTVPSSPPRQRLPPAPKVEPLELPRRMPLRDWITHHAENRPAIAGAGGNINISSWRGGGWQNKVDKKYLEQCVRVALSLATKMENQSMRKNGVDTLSPLIHENDLTLDNIIIVNTRAGEADFVEMSGTNDCHSPRNQRLEICALGRVFYEIFTQGSPPPPPKSKHARDSKFSDSFGSTLRISMDVEHERNEAEGEGNKNSMVEEEEGENAEIEQARPQRRRCVDQGREQSVSALLNGKCVPSSVCRLVADMLENEAADDDLGGIFRHDNAISTISDLKDDLKHMVGNPESFLHDSLLMRWKPVIADKMYGRDQELLEALEVAGRVSQRGNELEELGDSPIAHQVLIVSGHSGSGKSRLVLELSLKLGEKGWRYLHCKFDRVNPRPLSFIISAFDRYFSKLSSEIGNADLREVRKRLESFSNENISILHHLMPNLRHIVPEEEASFEACVRGEQIDFSDTEASKCRLHRLFCLLVKAISRRPVMLFVDDIHWADPASLDLMMALIHGVGEEIGEEMTLDSSGAHVMFVASFRSNEVTVSDPLVLCLQHIKQLSNVDLTEIQLSGLSCFDVNVVISEALRYPQRLTRSLSNLIHQKSTGNPLFIKEIINDLSVENLLNYSLSSRKWQWDEDLIQARTVSDGVAEILTRRLLRLPESVLTALRVLSIFGTEVPMRVLRHVRDVCGIPDIIAELGRSTKEGLIQKTTGGDAVVFVHDMIQHAVEMGIKPEERKNMLKEVSETLLVRTSEGRADDTTFILVDLINRVGPNGTPSPLDRMRYANLNLVAGEKAMQTPDYGSASTYLESGISFLNEDHWSENYNLSLHLFKKSAFVQHAQGETDLMMARLNEVLDNARNFHDKLDSLNVLIQSLSLNAKSVSNAFEQTLVVLRQLGESFPSTLEAETIGRELMDVKNKLEQHVPASISNIRPMENPEKIKAMDFLLMLISQCYQQKSRIFPLVGCRMVNITLQFGMHEKSAFGFSSFAMAYATVFKDMSQGYRLGKYALAITTPKNTPEVYTMLYGALNVWKEPIQAVLPQLMNAYKIGTESGNISFSLINSTLYIYRAFLSGSKLSSLSKEVHSFLRLYSLYKRHTLHMSVTPINNAILTLVGRNSAVLETNQETKGDDQILAKSLEVKELNIAETVVVCKMMCSFIFRDIFEAASVAKRYLDFFEQHDSLNFINIYRYLYGGLIAFDRFRKNGGQYWMDIGERSISKFEAWNRECKWNFQNKLLLLQAERLFTNNKMTEAEYTYDLAISSSKDHRFVHEQGLSCELAGIFYQTIGRTKHSIGLVRQAAECYKSWGAHEKTNLLLKSLE